MKKLFAIASAAIAAATTASAGNVTYVAPEVTMIEEPAAMGGSGAWLIPVIIIAILAIALIDTEDDL